MRSDTRALRAGLREPVAPWGAAYVATVLVVGLTATGLVVLRRADLWWLVPVSALTLVLAVVGRRALHRRGRGWTHAYVHGQAGSYIALVTATVVVGVALDDGPLTGSAQLVAWLGPTAVGTVLLEVWRRRLGPGSRQVGEAPDDDHEGRQEQGLR